MFDIPVLLIIFNRPDLTENVFASIRKIKPGYLFVAADGPRTNVPADKELCEAARKVVVDNIDWECNSKLLFREKNLGCGKAPAEAITWFFNNVDKGIILEDDTLPDTSFFDFCKVLLEKYENDKTVMHIGGNCFLPFAMRESYYFTNYTHVWGWATWKRAWNLFDINMVSWKGTNKSSFLKKILHHKRAEMYWQNKFDQMSNNDVKDIWDYQWTYTCWANNGLSVAPAINLVSNNGFRNDATHTFFQQSSLANLPTKKLDAFNIIHPAQMEISTKADKYIRDEVYLGKPISVIKKVINKFFGR